jgi:hypothetical protein
MAGTEVMSSRGKAGVVKSISRHRPGKRSLSGTQLGLKDFLNQCGDGHDQEFQ